jgi:flagellar protein FliO/FliZ
MFDTLFGAEMPLAVRFFLAFLIVLGLIGATAWAVRRFGTGRLGSNTRGRQPRLAVVDYASVDGRRRLILVRRDNVEHLMMIGGPTDVVVEPNIVRATPAARDVPGTRPTAGIDALPRAIPLPENGNGSAWPLAPESTVGLRPSPRLDSLPDELPARSFSAAPETPGRPQRDTLSALADELSTRPTPTPAPAPTLPRREARTELRRPIVPPAPPTPAITPAPAVAAEPPTAADQSLADMAQRLEAALRKPNETAPVATPSRATAATEPTLPPPPPRPSRPEAKPTPRTDAKPAQGKGDKTALYDSLEQEMASLLGRPNKT